MIKVGDTVYILESNRIVYPYNFNELKDMFNID